VSDFGEMKDFGVGRLVLEDVRYVGWREGRWEDAVALPIGGLNGDGIAREGIVRQDEILSVLRQRVGNVEM
jgi:hypothetical protein